MAQQRLLKNTERQNLQKLDVLKRKHKNKQTNQINNSDVLEWAKEKMIQELGIDRAS